MYTILASVFFTWVGWISILVIQHGKQIQSLIERINWHGEAIVKINDNMDDVKKVLIKVDKNIVRIGMSLKINDELEK